MPDAAAAAAAKAEAAAAKAEAAASRVEEAAKRARLLVIVGFAIALIGAVLVFTLDDSGATLLDSVRWQPLGGVLLAAGALLMLGAVVGMMGGGGNSVNLDSIQTVGGLIAVVAALIAVTALTIYTLTELESTDGNTAVAVTSSAFGIISAVVGAYLGIKITADTNREATAGLRKVVDAEHDAEISKQAAAEARRKAARVQGQLAGISGEVDELGLDDETAAKLKAAAFHGGEEKPPEDPPPGAEDA